MQKTSFIVHNIHSFMQERRFRILVKCFYVHEIKI